MDLHSLSVIVQAERGYFSLTEILEWNACHAFWREGFHDLTFDPHSTTAIFCFYSMVSLLPLGATHIPNKTDASCTYSRLRETLFPREEVATRYSSATASLAIHFPILQIYSIKYHQLLFTIKAPHVTSINHPQLLLKLCIEARTSSRSEPDWPKPQSST